MSLRLHFTYRETWVVHYRVKIFGREKMGGRGQEIECAQVPVPVQVVYGKVRFCI